MTQSPINLHDYQQRARQQLPAMVFDYYASGAHDEITLTKNQSAYQEISLRPRVLVDVSQRSLVTTALGHPLSFPVMIAPMAFQAMAHKHGEEATACAPLWHVARSSTHARY